MLSVIDDRIAATGFKVSTVSAAAAYTFGDYRVMGGVISVNDRTAANAEPPLAKTSSTTTTRSPARIEPRWISKDLSLA